MTAAGLAIASEYGVRVLSSTGVRCQQYHISVGWPAVLWGLRLKAGDRLQLEPISRAPWRLRLTLLPPDSAAAES